MEHHYFCLFEVNCQGPCLNEIVQGVKIKTMCRQDTFDFRLFQGACAPSLTCISKSVGLPTDLLSTAGMKSVCFLPALPVN